MSNNKKEEIDLWEGLEHCIMSLANHERRIRKLEKKVEE